MRIAHVTHSLAGSSGVQTYMTSVADEMQRVGHDVWLAADELGSGAEQAEQFGLRVAAAPSELPHDLDVAVVHSAASSHAFAETHPGVPQVFVVHGRTFDNYVPPQISGHVAGVVTLGDFAVNRVRSTAVEVPHLELTQPVDRMRFRDRNAIGERPRRALLLSNYVEGDRLALLKQACALAGLELRHAGATGDGVVLRPALAINEVDVVFGKGRAIVEAMACGRAAYVFDMWGTDGWVTPDSYEKLAAHGFGGVVNPRDPSVEELAADIAGYSNELGPWGVSIVIAKHSLDSHVRALVEFARSVAPLSGGASSTRDDRAELARLARQSWRHEGFAHVLSERLIERNGRIAELEAELQTMRGSRSWRLTAPLRRLRPKNR